MANEFQGYSDESNNARRGDTVSNH